MAKSKYTDHIGEILEMYANGMTSTEIVNYLNENYQLDGSESSIRTICQRHSPRQKDKIPEKQETPTISKKEVLTVQKMEELIRNEVQMRMTAQDFSIITQKYRKAFDIFSIINDDFDEATTRLAKRAKRDKINFLIAGCVIFIIVLALFTGYYIGRCFSRTAFLYILALTSAPGGICIGISVGFLIADIRNKKRLEEYENAVK